MTHIADYYLENIKSGKYNPNYDDTVKERKKQYEKIGINRDLSNNN